MSDAQLPPLQQWLIDVAANAKRRPWWPWFMRAGEVEWVRCRGCASEIPSSSGSHADAHNLINGEDPCPFTAIDAALDKEPT